MSSDAHDKPVEARTALGADLLIPVMATGLTVYYLLSTRDMDWEAKSTGLLVGTVLLALCAIQFFRLAKVAISGSGGFGFGGLLAATQHNWQRVGLIALTSVFIGTVGWIGTTLGIFLLLLGSLIIMGVRSPRVLLAVPTLTAATVYLLMILLLGTRLPRGIFERMMASVLGLQG